VKEKIFSILSPILAPVLYRVLPGKYVRTLKDKSIVWGFVPQKTGIMEKIMMRLMRPYFLKEFYSKSEPELRQANREQYWGGKAGKLWHEGIRKKYSSPEAFENEFVKRREPMTSMLGEFISDQAGKYSVLCEIGTGNGLYIHYLYEKYSSQFKKWVGIDLNAEQININKAVYKEKPINFISTEVGDWIKANSQESVLFLAVGTLEYFTQPELEEFFSQVKENHSNAAIALVEPISFDISLNKNSMPRGLYMFSHNYPFLLEKSGFRMYKSVSNPAEPGNPENKNQLLSIITYL